MFDEISMTGIWKCIHKLEVIPKISVSLKGHVGLKPSGFCVFGQVPVFFSSKFQGRDTFIKKQFCVIKFVSLIP